MRALALAALSSLAALGMAQPSFFRMPDVHEDRAVFSREGDLWIADKQTGRAERLTRHSGEELHPKFSPDGRQIAFSAEYEGGTEVYVIDTEGGMPRRVSFGRLVSGARPMAWTPDGQHIALAGSEFGAMTRAFTVPASGGLPQRLPFETVFALTFGDAPGEVQFVRASIANSAWRGYAGGRQNPIWIGDVVKGTFRKLVDGPGSCEFPVRISGRVAFIRHHEGRYSVESVPVAGGRAQVHFGPSEIEIRALETDGMALIFECGAQLYTLALGEKAAPLQFEYRSDEWHMRPYRVAAADFATWASPEPGGLRALVEARGQIVSADSGPGEARVVLNRLGTRLRMPTRSPDGNLLAYVSDATGEQQLTLWDGERERTLSQGEGRQIMQFTWSPDSKWIAYSDSETRLMLVSVGAGDHRELIRGKGRYGPTVDFSPDSRWIVTTETFWPSWHQGIVLIELATGKKYSLGDATTNDMAPSFSSDGKWLGFLSTRRIAPVGDGLASFWYVDQTAPPFMLALRNDLRSPLEQGLDAASPESDEFRIDFEGLTDRLIELPFPVRDYPQPFVGPNERHLTITDSAAYLTGSLPGGTNELLRLDLATGETKVLGPATNYRFSPDGKRILVRGPGGWRTIASDGSDSKPLDFRGLTLQVEPEHEWVQIYWDAWRLIRDFFYDAGMHGADWKQVGEKYAALLPEVRSRSELNQLIRWVLAELNVSHAGVGGGDFRSPTAGPTSAYLGASFRLEGGYPRIERIFRGDGFLPSERSPLAEPGVNIAEGEYLIAVAGVSTKENPEFLSALEGRAGQWVTLRVNSVPSEEGARSIQVRAAPGEDRVRYLDWYERNRRFVLERSGGRVGYVHLRNMVTSGMADFLRQYYRQRHLEGLVVDSRFNTGGNTSDAVNTLLGKRPTSWWNMRGMDDLPWTRTGDAFMGPMACLINEVSFSDGELFPHQFRANKLGPLIGMRTAGGEVGSDPGWSLIDGGSVSVPNYGAFDESGWIIEGRGVEPDIKVENDPSAFFAGRDLQLEAAVDYVVGQIEKNPRVKPTVPPGRRIAPRTRS